MIQLRTSKQGTPYTLASELWEDLQPGEPLYAWFKSIIKSNQYQADKQYWGFHNPGISQENSIGHINDWSIHIDMAKHITLMDKSDRAKALRDYLIFLDSQKSDGDLLTLGQVEALMDLADILGLFSVQEFLEREHFEQYVLNSKPITWWEYRAKLFGLTVDDIKSIIATYGIRYENQRQALFHIDRYELVRRACIDLFKAMGKSDRYASNMGKLAKEMAERQKVQVYNDSGLSISFANEKQTLTIEQVKGYKKRVGLLGEF